MIRFVRPLSKTDQMRGCVPSIPQLVLAPTTPFPPGYQKAKEVCLAMCQAALVPLDGLAHFEVPIRQLRAAYPRELNVFYKIREREDGTSRTVCDEWKFGTLAFARFLRDVGPSPGSDWKLRRIKQSERLFAAHTMNWVRRGDASGASSRD